MEIIREHSDLYKVTKNGEPFTVWRNGGGNWWLYIPAKEKNYNCKTLEGCFNAIANFRVTWERG